jgi:hypothetical protein
MKKLRSLITLDLMSIKQQLTIFGVVLYAVQAFAIAFMANSVWAAIVLGALYGIMLNNSTFYYAEKSNTDALCATLGLGRNIVVRNRYLSALVLSAGSIIFCLPLSLLGDFAALHVGFQHGIVFSPQIWVFSSTVLFIANAIQLPIYFKLGFSKAKSIAIAIPVLLIMALPAAFAYAVRYSLDNGISLEPLVSIFNSAGFMATAVMVLLVVVSVSYRLSLLFYRKRSF